MEITTRKALTIFAAAILFGVVCASPLVLKITRHPAPIIHRDLADNIAATVRVRRPDAAGSGVVVGPGLILTAGHVTRGTTCVEVDVFTPAGAYLTYRGTVIQCDDQADLALVHVSEPLPSPVVLGCGVAADLRAGTPCVAIGATAGHCPHNVTTGFFSGKQTEDLPGVRPGLWQVSCTGAPGNSGCGVYADGQLVGICIAGDSPCTMFIVPVDEVADFLRENQK